MHAYTKLEPSGPHAHDVELAGHSAVPRRHDDATQRPRPKLAYRRIFTANVRLTLLAHALLHFHLAAFGTLWVLLLSTPRQAAAPAPAAGEQGHGGGRGFTLAFAGGLGLPPQTIGLAIGIIGALGLCAQFGLYSRTVHRLGVLRAFRLALRVFPLVYLLAPLLALLPPPAFRSASPGEQQQRQQHHTLTPSAWLALLALLALHVAGRTFVLPTIQILVNNCSPHPSVLGAVHGVGQSVSSGARTLGPVVGAALFALGLRAGVGGAAWWALAVEAVLACVAGAWVRDGSGHEIWLEGD